MTGKGAALGADGVLRRLRHPEPVRLIAGSLDEIVKADLADTKHEWLRNYLLMRGANGSTVK